MKELILSVEETDEDYVEVLVGFLLHQIVAQQSDSLTMLMVVYVLLENLNQDIEAVLLWWQFGSLDRMDLRLPWKEDFADEDFMEELYGHDLGGLLREEEVKTPDEIDLLSLVCQ